MGASCVAGAVHGAPVRKVRLRCETSTRMIAYAVWWAIERDRAKVPVAPTGTSDLSAVCRPGWRWLARFGHPAGAGSLDCGPRGRNHVSIFAEEAIRS